MSYIMESRDEARRLASQESLSPSRDRLIKAGVKPGMRVLDAGCGSGAVTREISNLVGPRGHVVAIDPSGDRLAAARGELRECSNVELRQAQLPSSGLEDGLFDLCWSQFVFEYLPEPEAALIELVRLTRPGGQVAIAEIDGYGLGVWPATQSLLDGMELLQVALRKARFDLFVGRKIYSLLRKVGLVDVRVHLSAFHVTAGTADEALVEDWRIRFSSLAPIAVGTFKTSARWEHFTAEYLELLADPNALKYSVVLTTVGSRG